MATSSMIIKLFTFMLIVSIISYAVAETFYAGPGTCAQGPPACPQICASQGGRPTFGCLNTECECQR